MTDYTLIAALPTTGGAGCSLKAEAQHKALKAPTVVVINYACGGTVDGKTAAQIARQLRAAAPRREYAVPCRATFLDVTGLADDKQRLVKVEEPHDASLASALKSIGLDADFRRAAGGKWEMEC
jgi:hypothetical protein